MSGSPTGKFPKSAHLLKRADFQRVYKQGRRHFSGNMTVFYLRHRAAEVVTSSNDEGTGQTCARVGFTVPRAVGVSVERNRIRRRLREAVRSHLPLLVGGTSPVDVVFNPKRTVLKTSFEEISKEVERAFEVIRNTALSGARKPREATR